MSDPRRTASSPPSPTDRIAEEAARWSERLREAGADPQLRADFEAWRGADEEKARAFARADQAWATARRASRDPRVMALRNRALSRVAEPAASRSASARWAGLAAGAVLFVSAGFGLAHFFNQAPAPEATTGIMAAIDAQPGYATRIGERLSVALPDGSALTLNTASRAQLAYTPQERRVHLLAGQGYFDVAHDADRPFVVVANGRRITALGTAFEVRIDAADLSVTLVEGRVAVDLADTSATGAAQRGAAPSAPLRAELSPGERLVQIDRAPPQVAAVDARRLTSWLDGLVIFENDTLAEAVEEMNRYAQRPIVIADEDLEALRLSGAFGAGRSTEFVEALGDYFPEVRVETGDRAIVLTRAG